MANWKQWALRGILGLAVGYLGLGTSREFYNDTLGRRFARQEYQDLPLEDVVKRISTPAEAQRYCRRYIQPVEDQLLNGVEDYWSSFPSTHARQRGDCEDAAIAAMALLADDGYPPLMLTMYGPGEGHGVFLYRKNGKFGTVGINTFDYRPAAYDSLADIVAEYGQFTEYEVLDFSRVKRDSVQNLKLDPGLRSLGHARVQPSPNRFFWRYLTQPFR